MKRSKIRDLRRGDIFMTSKTFQKNMNLYICVRTRKPDENYYGYIVPYYFVSFEAIQLEEKYLRKKDPATKYNFYPDFQSRYIEMNPGIDITILDKDEVALMNIGK
jgi:hypothetical protein